MILTLFHVALGGALGSAGRYLVNISALKAFGPGFPVATMTVNVLGSFAMGLLVVTLARSDMLRLSPFLMTGLLGGFTTFSAYSLDAFLLWERGEAALAAAYVLGSVVLSLAALVAGVVLMRAVLA